VLGEKKLYHLAMAGRILAVDVGARRVGLAISDVSCTLARPLEAIAVSSDADAADRVARRIDDLADEDGGLATVVVGMPTRLDGSPSPQTSRVAAFIELLKARTSVTIATEGERLSSREAERRLAVHERDWRKRKKKLDAAAAAIILQDYLDRPR
jgi:putative Holliday junction resolvase